MRRRRSLAAGTVTVAAAAAALACAARPAAGAPGQEPADRVVPRFACVYVNFAWVPMVTGRVVDVDGRILAFDYRERMREIPGPLPGSGVRAMPLADVRLRGLSPAGRVERAELDAMAALVPSAASGPVERGDGGARDAGTRSCAAYAIDEAAGLLRVVELGTYGAVNDTRITNGSEAARRILAWLERSGVAR